MFQATHFLTERLAIDADRDGPQGQILAPLLHILHKHIFLGAPSGWVL